MLLLLFSYCRSKHGTDLVVVERLVPASSLHQKLVRQDTIIRAILVAVESDAASIPVLVKCLLEACSEPQKDSWSQKQAH